MRAAADHPLEWGDDTCCLTPELTRASFLNPTLGVSAGLCRPALFNPGLYGPFGHTVYISIWATDKSYVNGGIGHSVRLGPSAARIGDQGRIQGWKGAIIGKRLTKTFLDLETNLHGIEDIEGKAVTVGMVPVVSTVGAQLMSATPCTP